jgi:hypothetical protein
MSEPQQNESTGPKAQAGFAPANSSAKTKLYIDCKWMGTTRKGENETVERKTMGQFAAAHS